MMVAWLQEREIEKNNLTISLDILLSAVVSTQRSEAAVNEENLS